MARTLIAGAGALGSVYGGLLAGAGADVVLLARGAHAEAVRQGGLEVRLPDERRVVPVPVADEGEADFVIVTAKAFDTPAVLERVRGEPQAVVSFQNGPTKNRALVDRFGPAAVLGGASMVAAELVEPGVVESDSLGATYLGEIGGGSSARSEQLAELIRAAGLETHLVDDIGSVEWSKLAVVAALMVVQGVSRRYVHEILLSGDARGVLAEIVTEVASIARAEGVEVANWPGLLPVAAIVADGRDGGAEPLRLLGERLEAIGRTAYRTSMLQSLESGRPTELEAIHGELLRIAADRGVAVPALETAYRLARLAGA